MVRIVWVLFHDGRYFFENGFAIENGYVFTVFCVLVDVNVDYLLFRGVNVLDEATADGSENPVPLCFNWYFIHFLVLDLVFSIYVMDD